MRLRSAPALVWAKMAGMITGLITWITSLSNDLGHVAGTAVKADSREIQHAREEQLGRRTVEHVDEDYAARIEAEPDDLRVALRATAGRSVDPVALPIR